MTSPPGEETDRAVSRRVDNPTRASAEDERVYAAAPPRVEPEPDTATGGTGTTAERAARDVRETGAGSEPTRSE